MHTDPTTGSNPHQQHQHHQHSFTLYPPLPLPTQPSYAKRHICVFHAQGRCTKGAACRFSHDDTNPFSLFNAADYFPSLYPPTNTSTANGQGLNEPRGSLRSYKELQHRTRHCSFYLAGKCTRGERCTFLHDPAALEAGLTAEDLERGRTTRPEGWTKQNVTCKFWLSGRCKKEDSCPFRHEEPELELEQILPKADRARPRSLSLVQLESLILKDGSSLMSRRRSGSETSEEGEGEGSESSASPPALSSGTSETGEDAPMPETPGVEDMPHDVAPAGYKPLITSVVAEEPEEMEESSITRTFLTDRGGEATVTLGAGLVVERVELPTDAQTMPANKSDHPTLLISFPAPTRTAYTTYPSARVAQKEAHRLDGRVIRGRKVVAKSNTFAGNFAATISGLPADMAQEELRKLTKANSLSLGDPTFNISEAVEKLRSKLTDVGELESFDLLPTSPTENKIYIYARCQDASASDTIIQDLQGQMIDFLANGALNIEQVYTAKYTVLPRHWSSFKVELEKIEKAVADTVRLRIPVCPDEPLWLQGKNRQDVLAAMRTVASLLTGVRVDAHKKVSLVSWSNSVDGKGLLAQIEKDTNTSIQLDERSNTLVVYGIPESARLAAEKLKVALASQGTKPTTIPGPIFMTRSEIDRSDQCDICSCPITDNVLRSSSCGHTFCYDCLRRYIQDAALPLNCPARSCRGMLPISLVRLALPDESEFDALLESAFLDHIRSRPTHFAWCPTPDCWTLYRSGSDDDGDVLQCPNCRARICTACQSEMHDGFDCYELRFSGASEEEDDGVKM